MGKNKTKAQKIKDLKAKRYSKQYLRAHPEIANPDAFNKDTRTIAKIENIGRPVEWTEERIANEAALFNTWLNDEKNYYFNKFALDRGYTSAMLNQLADKSPIFAKTLHRARELQEQRIATNSLDRTFDGNFAKFVLANRHGWKEKTEISGDAANPLSFILGNIDGKTKDIIDVTPEVASNGE